VDHSIFPFLAPLRTLLDQLKHESLYSILKANGQDEDTLRKYYFDPKEQDKPGIEKRTQDDRTGKRYQHWSKGEAPWKLIKNRRIVLEGTVYKNPYTGRLDQGGAGRTPVPMLRDYRRASECL
jgi:hypothetical protein